ncbi:MAG TPA: hypothetical protein VK943_15945 [Arenibaculum sp.]|nr:hypothetical protein [Arenibaculum sp.]
MLLAVCHGAAEAAHTVHVGGPDEAMLMDGSDDGDRARDFSDEPLLDVFDLPRPATVETSQAPSKPPAPPSPPPARVPEINPPSWASLAGLPPPGDEVPASAAVGTSARIPTGPPAAA